MRELRTSLKGTPEPFPRAISGFAFEYASAIDFINGKSEPKKFINFEDVVNDILIDFDPKPHANDNRFSFSDGVKKPVTELFRLHINNRVIAEWQWELNQIPIGILLKLRERYG